ncbi:MAG: hypothetical protein ACP5IA_07295 [Sediminispirochaetaceae bacterium]
MTEEKNSRINIHKGIDRISTGIGSLYGEKVRFFREGIESPPLIEIPAALEMDFSGFTEEGEYRIPVRCRRKAGFRSGRTRSETIGCILLRGCKAHLIETFFILTFLISWSFWIPMVWRGEESGLLRVEGTFGPLYTILCLLVLLAAGIIPSGTLSPSVKNGEKKEVQM